MKVLYSLNLFVLLCLLAVLGHGAVQAQDAAETPASATVAGADGEQVPDQAIAPPAPPRDGSVVRIDIPSEDLEESREFYGEVFGWTFTEDEESAGRYLYWQDGAGNSGGFSSFVQSGNSTGVVLYLHSDDLDESFKLINRAGGKSINFTMEIENGAARVGLFTDPQGNMLGLISPIG